MDIMFMKERIAILTPSRGRPERLLDHWVSFLETVAHPELIHLYIYIDGDDQCLEDYKCLDFPRKDLISMHIGPRTIMSDMVNILYDQSKQEEIIYFGADDLLMRTEHWDEVIRKGFDRFLDKLVLFFGRDDCESQHISKEFSSHPVIHRNFVDAVGYVSPPIFTCDFADTWINDIFKRIGRVEKLPYYNEHVHYLVGS